MIEQKVLIQMSEDPFDTKEVTVRLPNDVKLMSNRPYALEMLNQYGISTDLIQAIKLGDNRDAYTTRGVVISIEEDDNGKKISAIIDTGSKFSAYCSLSNEPKIIVEQLQEGIEIDVKISKDQKGSMIASISDAIHESRLNELKDSIEDETVAYSGKVTELIHGGYWVDVSGVRCFMPGSLGGVNKLHDFESLIDKEINVMPIGYSDEKDTIIVSHRAYLKTLIPIEVDKLEDNFKEKITGFVTGTAKFGVFAEFNECLTGLIPVDNLDEESTKKYHNRDIKPGDEISFWLNNIISNNKIILSQRGPKIDAWEENIEKYKPMMVTEAKVVNVVKYGVFVELERGIRGLIHKSKLDSDHDLTKGQQVEVKIHSINNFEKKIDIGLVRIL